MKANCFNLKERLLLAVLFSYKRAQELSIKYSKELPKGEIGWQEIFSQYEIK